MPTGHAEAETPAVVTRPVTAESYKAAFRRHPGGVAVVTADPGDGPVALTLTSLTSVNLDPPLLAFSLSHASSAAAAMLRASTVVVHLLDVRHLEIAKLGASSGVDRFADRRIWTRLPGGEPLFHSVTNWLRCRVAHRLEVGGATLMICEVLETGESADEERTPLVYQDRAWFRLESGARL
ncbi:MAG: hypothetical protein BGO95_03940 [Micrococcales bacterium 73-13]|nr:MAG: hypothetical protein BGO95_03940 [Micrococcales bacterium 73-13]